jgi:hypothetical protein
MTFLVKVNPPALQLIGPINGTTSGRKPVFYGTAGNAAGDSTTVSVLLFNGTSVTGKPVATQTVTRAGAAWLEQWLTALPLGLYTVLARQTDVVGHVTTTPAVKFIVVPNPPVIGNELAIAQNGVSSVPIYCSAKVNALCVGTVTMSTVNKLSVGHHKQERLTLISEPLSIYGTTTFVSRGHGTREERAALRRVRSVAVQVTVKMSIGGGPTHTFTRVGRASVAH